MAPWRNRAAQVGVGVALVFLALWSYRPVEKILDATLDGSNFGSYAYFTAHGFNFGRDVVAVTGPYGFINYGFVYTGDLFWTRFALELTIKGAFAALVWWFFRYSAARFARWIWLAAIVLTAPLIEDTCYDLCILLGGIYLLAPRRGVERLAGGCLVAALLALLSLCKGTQVFFSLGTMALVVLDALVSRRFRRGVIIVSAYVVTLVVLWLSAGQNLLDLPAFIKGVQETASGYNNAMGLDEAPVTTRLGLSVLAALVIAAISAAWLRRRSLAHVLACIFFAGFAFTQWKHGFVRADGHVFIFFIFGVSAAFIPLLLVAGPDVTSGRFARVAAGCAALAALAFGIQATCYSNSGPVWLNTLRTAFRPKVHQVLHPAAAREELEAGLDFHRRKYELPVSREKIGAGTVDFFGSDHGFIPLNGLHYHPRPVGGGNFTVYTEYLKALNERFLLDPARRPDFYLVKTEILDNRLLTQEDSRSFPLLLHLYRPILTERSVLLFEKTPAAVPPPAPRMIERRSFHWGESVGIPAQTPGADEITLATFEIELNWVGRLRALFYKPPQVYLSLSGEGIVHRESVRLIPEMMRSPVILSPVIEDAHDLLGLYTTAPGKRVQDLRVASNYSSLFRSDQLHVSFYRMPRPSPVREAAAISALTRFPCANIGAESAEPAAFPHYLEHYVVGFHAPSHAVFPLEGTERAIDMRFGLEPAAYANGNATNGVVFLVDLELPGGARQSVFRRHLDPVKSQNDRGEQTAHIVLPPVRRGFKLVLSSDPGPHDDRAWDWSYVSSFLVERGAYQREQFPGFNVAPVEVEGEGASEANIGDRSVFMLNAPGRVTFALTGAEKTLTFSGGLMPGAYTNGGRSDGTAFVAELHLPDGKTEQVCYRLVNPRDVPADAGLQTFTATLPAHAAGSRLTVRTDAGPAGDRSWDWSYICDVRLE